MSPKAVVYVLHREDGSRNNLSKVGSTKISADGRAANYTDGGWTAYFTAEVPAHVRFAVERKAHSILSKKGLWLDPTITGGTANEIFTCTPNEAQNAIVDAIQMIKSELSDFIGDEIALSLTKAKHKNLELAQKLESQDKELESLKKIHKDQLLIADSYKIINEAEHIKKLQARIRALDKSLNEKDREISSLRIEITRLNDARRDNQGRNSRKGRK